ncbi:unnamed protein product [Acanthoscelides obtectus]|uniref:Uncharacterized protein n=1 Tax=Acanthoscelides obtectus TaxID=200917 RepID=A0A9P0JLE5_ACAOB|nr:unnamed protein product [Acanthoscelides obtectus]CAK1654342.1 hypothetical protein AOBTE_LOCUS18533 [Acanthoscelides obtectus]
MQHAHILAPSTRTAGEKFLLGRDSNPHSARRLIRRPKSLLLRPPLLPVCWIALTVRNL